LKKIAAGSSPPEPGFNSPNQGVRKNIFLDKKADNSRPPKVNA
jgi:hypothetical protein